MSPHFDPASKTLKRGKRSNEAQHTALKRFIAVSVRILKNTYIGDAVIQNELLGKLLTLQQDGQRAISGPSNWLHPTVLEVRTSLHDVVDELEKKVGPQSDGQRVGRWHFFVGSPGNGKSAGAGMLARRLRDRGDIIKDFDSDKTIDELGSSDVPYRLDVYEAGKPYPYLFIAQDASVLPDPYDPNADPAHALEELVQKAAERGVSLVVCTNRGVIERAFSNIYLDKTKNGEAWFKAFKMAVGTEQTGQIRLGETRGKRVFDSIEVGVTSLDRHSLVLANDTLERLILDAIESPDWEVCNGCPSRTLCPFRANRDWLAEPDLRKNVLIVLLHAELFDGQVIVLREALALISLLLAGCPHDYSSEHPCDWVHRRTEAGDVFALASRRLYMLLFSSYSPVGLAPDSEDRSIQIEAIGALLKGQDFANAGTVRAARFAIHPDEPVSTDVGVQRLLGKGKVLSALDPFGDVLPLGFLDRWNESWLELQNGGAWISDIERSCFAYWDDLQKTAAISPDSSPAAYRWLTRWITSFTLRAGALVEGVTTFGDDLEELASILSITGSPNSQQVELLEKIEATLAQSLYQAGDGVALTPSTNLHGEWVKQALKPRLLTGAASGGGITATLRFGSKATTPLNTRAFIWLKRKAERAMASATFPNEYLETARDAMLRIAVTSNYDIQDDIELIVNRGNGPAIKIKRSHGGIVVDAS